MNGTPGRIKIAEEIKQKVLSFLDASKGRLIIIEAIKKVAEEHQEANWWVENESRILENMEKPNGNPFFGIFLQESQGGFMRGKMSRREIDKLADVHWWIKGFRAGFAAGSCPFNTAHEDALEKAQCIFDEELEQKESGQSVKD